MNKQDEIKILRRAAADLGPDSYCGPWLAQQIDGIERDIASDYLPQIDLNETRRQCDAELARCNEAAKQIRECARKEAEETVRKAREEACAVRGNLLGEIRRCQATLGVSF